ncbi:hypothetical protein PISMIDRAFT_682795 [Pisolithus microcarpus 441]|uniref:Uncharacterized protein n=1 Tax=Pisolithus microcarpus 441 TaxID=765257 RepID=A0A0C9Y4Y4_9AGAM|nr:hypothetical protein PISMIDRAFT_682795 [Pisolithus microcarpus 441]
MYEGNWATAEKAAPTSEDVSILISKATASGECSDGNAQGVPDEEGEDEETITVEIDEHGPLTIDDVVVASPVAKSFEDEDESRQFRLSSIDFAHMRLVPGQGPDTGVLLVIDTQPTHSRTAECCSSIIT